jgi:hypothetical protein
MAHQKENGNEYLSFHIMVWVLLLPTSKTPGLLAGQPGCRKLMPIAGVGLATSIGLSHPMTLNNPAGR